MSENQANTLLNASVLKNKHKRNIAINILVFILRNVLQNWIWGSFSPSVWTAQMSTWSLQTSSRLSMLSCMVLIWLMLEAVGFTPSTMHWRQALPCGRWTSSFEHSTTSFIMFQLGGKILLPWLGPTHFRYHSVATGGLRVVCHTHCKRIWPKMSVLLFCNNKVKWNWSEQTLFIFA